MVRSADVKRGWGKYYSKSCKAIAQERRTGQYGNYRGSNVSREVYLHYAKEFGGVPQFSRNGDYLGFTDGNFTDDNFDF